MEHRKLDALMTPVERIARVAAAGVNLAKAPQTAPSGAISLDNADGTRTIIGEVVNGESNPSYTMATHVGDTTPPGIPTGITATSKSGVVVVEWDGTLSGGIPDDFFCVRIYLDNVELGALTEAGSVASAKLDGGTTVSVTATSEDDCCLPDGTPDHNVSQASQAISITVTSSAEEIVVDVEDEIEGIQQEITDFKGNTYTKAETDKKVQDLDDEISTELTTNYYNKTQIDTNYATKTLVSQTKEEIKLSASQTYATKGESQPNLSPFYAHDLTDIYDATDNPDGYFWNDQASSPELGVVGTQLDDGWMHYELDNSERTGYAYVYPYQRPIASLKPSTAYTLLIELRNMVTDAPYSASFRITSQPDDATRISQTVNPNGYDDIYLARGGTFCKALATKPDMSAATLFCRQYIALAAGLKASFDLRLSLYETVSPELLLDTNAPTLTKVDGPFDRYFSDASNTQVEMTYGAISDQPEELGEGTRYGFTADYDGSYNGARARALAFYSGSQSGDAAPQYMEAGKQYQATWWARVVSGTAYGKVVFVNTSSTTPQPSSNTALPYTSEWRRYTASVRPTAPTYSRVWFYANFAANKAGKAELCGFSLQEMDATFKPYVTDQAALSKEYSTKAELTVGLAGIRQEVAAEYQTIDGMGAYSTTAEMNAAIQTSATGIEQSVAATYSTKQATADAIAAIQVGGRNLIALENTYNGWLSENGRQGNAGSANNRRTGFIPVEAGEPYVAQTWVETFNNTSDGASVYLVWYDADETYISGIPQVGGSGSKYQVIKATAPANAAYCRVSWRAHRVGYAKLEQGTLPTDYTAAPEDLVARPNLTPFGSHPLDDVYDATDNPDGYWAIRPNAAYVTQLADGWLHFERANSGTGVVGSSMQIRPISGVEPGELLTVLIEVRNNQSTAMSTTGNFDDLYVQQGTNFQLWGTTVQSSSLTNNAQARPLSTLGESFELRFTKVVDSDHKTGDYIVGFAINIRNGAGQTLSFDFRVSVYRGGYEGGYVPYSIEDTTLSKTYTKSSTFTQTVNGLDGRITATEDGLAIQETLIRQYAGGVLVCKVGEAVGALVNASGSFDVVSVTWSGNEPTVGTTAASFTATDLLLGLQANNASVSLLGGTGSLSASNDWTKEQTYGLTLRGPHALGVHTGGSRAVGISMEKSFERRIIDPTQPPTAADTSTLSINAPQPSISYGAEFRLVFAKKLWDETSKEFVLPGDSVNLTVPDSGVFGTTGLQVGGFYNNGEQWPSGTSMRGIFFGSKVVNPNSSATMTLFTASECQSMFGRALDYNKDVIIVQNGDTGAYSGQITGGTNASGALMASINPTKSGPIRYQYIVILGA